MFHGSEARDSSSAPAGSLKGTRKREGVACLGLKGHLLLRVLWQVGTLEAKVPLQVLEVPGQTTSLGFVSCHFTCREALPMRAQSLEAGLLGLNPNNATLSHCQMCGHGQVS